MPNTPTSGWTPPPDDAATASAESRRRTSRRGLAWLIITLVVLGFAVVVLSGVVDGGRSAGAIESPVASGTERQTMERLNAAVVQWNEAAKPVMADMDDPTLDVPGFGGRTASDRATMRASIEAMEAAIAPGTNAEFAAAVREVIASYRDKIEVIDGFVVAVAESDSSGMDAALGTWEAAIARQRRALSAFLEAARPYLTPAEISTWEQVLAGS